MYLDRAPLAFYYEQLIFFLGSVSSLWVCIAGVLKWSLQLLREVKELYQHLMMKGEEYRKCQMKWVELTVDALLCLSIETLRHMNSSADHMTTRLHHMITSPDNMTTKNECRELICSNLSEFTAILDLSQSIYILKELVCLHQKILTYSSEQYHSLSIHSSLSKVFQSSIFTGVVRSWLNRDAKFISPTEITTQVHVRNRDTTMISHTNLLLSSMIENNGRDSTLESSLISTVMRKGVLLFLRYLASILAADKKATDPTWPSGNVTHVHVAVTCECMCVYNVCAIQ